jgi:hypothetical protein
MPSYAAMAHREMASSTKAVTAPMTTTAMTTTTTRKGRAARHRYSQCCDDHKNFATHQSFSYLV